MLTDALLPCPRCEEPNDLLYKRVYSAHGGHDVWIVECQRCGYLKPIVRNRQLSYDSLVSEWNKLPRRAAN